MMYSRESKKKMYFERISAKGNETDFTTLMQLKKLKKEIGHSIFHKNNMKIQLLKSLKRILMKMN
ncbi:hypothetical protein [Methanobrevibacter woesei]|uniref:hypothetical protein n=1 Tax=Methanobrevibacter woesei TaxID=190976 RepID=UPI0026DFEAA6|nr:hypothetical protein [Methanobrevibacter woesei]